jgi:16S rRNA (cytidine1402-2'-O)-methyltransferase
LKEEGTGTLSLVASPIGNLDDFSIRAIRTIKEADFVLAEDTRRSVILINHFEIGRKELISFSEQKIERKLDTVISRLLDGEKGVLLTDAGMPGIADPGSRLVKACQEKKIPVDVIPGASAVVSAFACSGFSGSFIFEGFLPRAKRLKRLLAKFVEEERAIIFFESRYRLRETLELIEKILGDRQIFIAKEMTKIHQQFFFGRISEIKSAFEGEIQGEYTIVLGGKDINDGP